MEHTQDYYTKQLSEQQAKLAEQESHAELTKLQVRRLTILHQGPLG